MSTHPTDRESHFTLDQLQVAIERTFGMKLDRADQTETGCKLVATSPTGVELFTITAFASRREGWQVGAKGYLLDGCWDALVDLHQGEEAARA